MLAIVTAPIDVAAVAAAVSHRGAGALATFVGTVRDHHEGRAVTRIDYEVHAPMAEAVLARIAAEVTDRWPDVRLACVHRHGLVELGEASVAIACAAPHRAEAFAACRHVIERIKQDLPVWKREFHPDGSATWAACHHTDPDALER
jgi:molybdopterin synthase catalytic subunit